MGHFFMEITCLEATLSYINKSNDLSDWYQLYFPTDLSYLLSVVYIDSLDGFTFQNQPMSNQTRPDMLEIKFLHSLTHGTSLPVSSCLLKQVL